MRLRAGNAACLPCLLAHVPGQVPYICVWDAEAPLPARPAPQHCLWLPGGPELGRLSLGLLWSQEPGLSAPLPFLRI